MNIFKKTLAAVAIAVIIGGPALSLRAQTSTSSTDTSGTVGTTTPGVPSTGIRPGQAAANAVLLAISAVTALVGGYYLTSGRKSIE